MILYLALGKFYLSKAERCNAHRHDVQAGTTIVVLHKFSTHNDAARGTFGHAQTSERFLPPAPIHLQTIVPAIE